MPAPNFTTFKATTNFNNALFTEKLEKGIQLFFDWAFLNIGAFTDIVIPNSVINGGNLHTLKAADTTYKIYDAPRKNLVYEDDVSFNGNSPIVPQVYVNDVLQTTGYNVDYPNGRVIFSSAKLSTDVITMTYSYKNVSVELEADSELWKELQYGSLRVENTHWGDKEKGDWTAKNVTKRLQMPAIIIGAVPRRNFKPWEVGSKALTVYSDVLFHVVAETKTMRDKLTDIVSLEHEKTIWLIDTQSLVGTTAWPLTFNGYKNASGLTYPELVDGYKWLRCIFNNMVVSDVKNTNPHLFESTIRCTTETVFTED